MPSVSPTRLRHFFPRRVAGTGGDRLTCSYLLAHSLFKIVLIENNWRVFCHNKLLACSFIRSFGRNFVRSFPGIGRRGRGTERCHDTCEGFFSRSVVIRDFDGALHLRARHAEKAKQGTVGHIVTAEATDRLPHNQAP